ncbi:MAG: hypothetical protein EOO45_17895 [Flavobacterium sp.]|nr:MAG: hypothetical protein EOO45_17895 [Flavobacterium sp.]
MCTVSFVASSNKIIITSNRDEQVTRPAIPPDWYTINGKLLFFPKDPRAGGTWFATDELGNTLVLLNGAAEKHQMRTGYRRSRGLIVLDILSDLSPRDCWEFIDLDNIEPFTIVLYLSGQLWQLRWDGIAKDTVSLPADKSYIWSSSPLYTIETQRERAKRFKMFISGNTAPGENDLYIFHTFKGDDPDSGLIINRDNILKTLSITQNTIHSDHLTMSYHDLAEGKEYTNKLSL